MKEMNVCGVFYGHKFYEIEEGLFLVGAPIGVQYDDFFILGLPFSEILKTHKSAKDADHFWGELFDYEVSLYHDADKLPYCHRKLETELIRLSR